jgi:hypothetical protein
MLAVKQHKFKCDITGHFWNNWQLTVSGHFGTLNDSPSRTRETIKQNRAPPPFSGFLIVNSGFQHPSKLSEASRCSYYLPGISPRSVRLQIKQDPSHRNQPTDRNRNLITATLCGVSVQPTCDLSDHLPSVISRAPLSTIASPGINMFAVIN